jgi:pyrophosphatase PpaX
MEKRLSLPKVILFDWDLTLVNTLDSRDEMVDAIESEFNYTLSKETIQELFGLSLWHGFNLLYDLVKPSMRVDEFHTFMNEVTVELNKKYVLADQNVVEVLKTSHDMGIVSNNNAENIEVVLDKYPPLFDGLWAGKEDKTIKLVTASDWFGVNPEETMYIGDHPSDIFAARTVGMPVISIESPLFTKGELMQYKPDFIIQSLDDLLQFS